MAERESIAVPQDMVVSANQDTFARVRGRFGS